MTKKKKYHSGGKWAIKKIALIRKKWFGGKCMWDRCEETKNLEFAHATPTDLSKLKQSHRGSYERYQDLLDNPECFLLFCSVHHRLFDGRTINQTWRNNYNV